MTTYSSNSIHPALQRLALWRAACAKEISVEELYRRLGELRERYGEARYDHRAVQRRANMRASA
jgi:hypothetical protein